MLCLQTPSSHARPAARAQALFFNHLYDPISLVRDNQIKAAMAAAGVHCRSFNADVLFEPWLVLAEGGRPDTCCKDFWNRCARVCLAGLLWTVLQHPLCAQTRPSLRASCVLCSTSAILASKLGDERFRCDGGGVARRAMSLPFPPPEPLPPPRAMRAVPEEVVSVELANLGLMTPEEEQSNQQLLFTVPACAFSGPPVGQALCWQDLTVWWCQPRTTPGPGGEQDWRSDTLPAGSCVAQAHACTLCRCTSIICLCQHVGSHMTCSAPAAQWTPGSKGAHMLLDDFVLRRLAAFDADRAKTDRASTSRLSPHVHFGEISVRFIFHVVRSSCNFYPDPRCLEENSFRYTLWCPLGLNAASLHMLQSTCLVALALCCVQATVERLSKSFLIIDVPCNALSSDSSTAQWLCAMRR